MNEASASTRSRDGLPAFSCFGKGNSHDGHGSYEATCRHVGSPSMTTLRNRLGMQVIEPLEEDRGSGMSFVFDFLAFQIGIYEATVADWLRALPL